MSSFKLYPSIESLRSVKIEDVAKNCLWVATEKVHGSNFSISTDGKSTTMFRRNGPVGGDAFFGCSQVVAAIQEKVFAVFRYVNDTMKLHQSSIRIFGELFGGSYPHPSIGKMKGKPVQIGIWYAPTVEFYAYDVFLDDENKFMNFKDAEAAFLAAHLLYAKPLKIGTFEEVNQIDPETLLTALPAEFNLPPIEKNFAEGIVMKPLTEMTWNEERLIIKKKRLDFDEVRNKPKNSKDEKEAKDSGPANAKVAEFQADVVRYVTENRLRAVLSKMGDAQRKDRKLLNCEFIKDVLRDFQKDLGPQMKQLNPTDAKAVRQAAVDASQAMVRDNFSKIMNGNF